MEQEEGIIWSIGQRGRGFIRTPGKTDRIFWLKDAPQALSLLPKSKAIGKSVAYRVKSQGNGLHDMAVEIRLMEVA